jgi:hypothetical protein
MPHCTIEQAATAFLARDVDAASDGGTKKSAT